VAPAVPRVPPYGAAEALAGLNGGDEARVKAFNWLMTTDPAPSEPRRDAIARALEPLLKDPREAERAARALSRWATMENLPALAVASWSDNPRVSVLVKAALIRLRKAGGPEAEARIDEAVTRGREVALREGIPAALAAARGTDLSAKIDALGKLGMARVEPRLQDEVASTLVGLLRDPNPVVRANAVAALNIWGRPGDHRAIAGLLTDKMPLVRAKVLAALGGVKDPEIIASVVALGGKPGVPTTELDAAVRGYGPLAEPALIDVVANGSGRPRQWACRMLESLGTEKALPALREAETDGDQTVARSARRAVQSIERKLGLEPSAAPATQRKDRPRPTRKNTRAMPNAGQRNAPRGSGPGSQP
jgi:HEAT repeat protein